MHSPTRDVLVAAVAVAGCPHHQVMANNSRSVAGFANVHRPARRGSFTGTERRSLVCHTGGFDAASVAENGRSVGVITAGAYQGGPACQLGRLWRQTHPRASFQFTFTNAPRTRHSVLGSTNAALATANWDVLGSATEVSSGSYQFTDLRATHRPRSF